MIHSKSPRLGAGLLLATAVLWLMMVTLCSGGVLLEDCHDHEMAGHDHPAPDGDHHDGCCCQSVHVFAAPALAFDSVKAPPADSTDPVGFFSHPAKLFGRAEALLPGILTTIPPERTSFATLVLHRCRQSQAPPLAA